MVQTSSFEELKKLFVLSIQKVRAALVAQGVTEEILTTDYQTENMSDWAVELTPDVNSGHQTFSHAATCLA